MDKKSLSEADICMKYINPAIEKAGWDLQRQVRREYGFTAGRIIVRGKLVARGKRKRADYVLYRQKNLPLAIIEAKDNTRALGAGMQQALAYSEDLDVPFGMLTLGCAATMIATVASGQRLEMLDLRQRIEALEGSKRGGDGAEGN